MRSHHQPHRDARKLRDRARIAEDEAENVGDKPPFASGALAEFMTSTKSISDAMEAYGDSVRAAKTEHILEEDRCTADLKEQNGSVGGRAKQRRLAK
jgi:hypothetical protein